MTKNPDPTLPLTSLTGTTRTLDDWTTMFHMVLVVLPDRPEGAQWVPIGERIFATFGDSDAKVAFLVPGPAPMANRLLEHGSGKYSVYLDPDRALIASLGLERLPALVHLRQNSSLANVAEGDPGDRQGDGLDLPRDRPSRGSAGHARLARPPLLSPRRRTPRAQRERARVRAEPGRP